MPRVVTGVLATLVLLTFPAAASALKPDPGFADHGVLTVPNPSEYSFGAFNGIVELSGERIVAGGNYEDSSADTGGPVLVGLDPSGSPDPGFGGDGVVDDFLAATKQGSVGALAETPDGRLIAIGDGAEGEAGAIFVAAFLPDGTLDPGFGTGGVRLVDVPESYERLAGRALEVLPDGRIQFTIKSKGGRKWYSILSVIRLDPDGSDDESFGTGGRAALPPQIAIAGGSASCKFADYCLQRTASGMAVDTAGRTWLSSGYDAWHHRLTLGRLTSAGRVDRSFGRHGRVNIKLDPRQPRTFLSLDAGPIVATPDGGAVVASGMTLYRNAGSRSGGIVVARFDEGGRLERRFGSRGFTVVKTPMEGAAADIVRSGGGFAVSGLGVNYPDDGVIGGLRRDGSLDPAFGGNGAIIAKGSRPISNGLSLDVDSSGRLLVAGYSHPDGATRAVALRYLP